MLVTHNDDTIRNATIVVDQRRFVRCAFTDCHLIFTGSDDTEFVDCTFTNCSWSFDGAAERTLTYLARLANEAGANQRRMVESVVEGIFNREFLDPQDADRLPHESAPATGARLAS